MSFAAQKLALILALLSCSGGALLGGEQVFLQTKASLATFLIERAWKAHLADGRTHRPWGWADMHPVARLEVPRLGVKRTVLSGAAGGSLAFGLGHLDGSSPPNGPGNCVVAGHRDGTFAFLEKLTRDDVVRLRTRAVDTEYRVRECFVVPMHADWVSETTSEPQLTLVTCYPFDAWRETGLRFVVLCTPT